MFKCTITFSGIIAFTTSAFGFLKQVSKFTKNWTFVSWTFCILDVLYPGRSVTGCFVTGRYVTGRSVGAPSWRPASLKNFQAPGEASSHPEKKKSGFKKPSRPNPLLFNVFIC
jgi:hypothetical protein